MRFLPSILFSALAALSSDTVQAELSASRFLGYSSITEEVFLLDDLRTSILNVEDRCANDVENFCSPHPQIEDYQIFLSFGNGEFPSSPLSSSMQTTTMFTTIFYVETDEESLLEVFDCGNRRLQSQSELYIHGADEIQGYLNELSEHYPRPIYGFGEQKDICLQTILNGNNPHGDMYAPPVLSQTCQVAARKVSDRYIKISQMTKMNSFLEMVSRVTIITVIILSMVASFLITSCQTPSLSEMENRESSFCLKSLKCCKGFMLFIIFFILVVVSPVLYIIIIPSFFLVQAFLYYSLATDEDDNCEEDHFEYVTLIGVENADAVYVGVPLRVI